MERKRFTREGITRGKINTKGHIKGLMKTYYKISFVVVFYTEGLAE